jgi:hypothetical protein
MKFYFLKQKVIYCIVFLLDNIYYFINILEIQSTYV